MSYNQRMTGRSHDDNCSYERGYTLIEIVVTVIIMGLLTTMGARGYNDYRDSNRLKMAEQMIQAAAREALQTATNEDREHACINQAGKPLCVEYSQSLNSGWSSTAYQPDKMCSDIGIVTKENEKEIIFVADVNGEEANDIQNDNKDCIFKRVNLPEGVTFTTSTSYLFEVSPPASVTMYPGANIKLKAGSKEIELKVSKYGQVERM